MGDDTGQDEEGLGEASGPDFEAPLPDRPTTTAPELGVEPRPDLPSSPAPTPSPDPSFPTAWADVVPRGTSVRRQSARLSRPRVQLIVGLVTAVVLVVAVAVSMAPTWRAVNGTPRSTGPTSAPFTPMPAQPMAGDHFAFTSPDGWARSADWGTGNDASLSDGGGNAIHVYSWTDDDAAGRCERELSALQIWVPGEISSVPGRKVGGRPAPGGSLVGEQVYVLRCVVYQGLVFNMSSKADPDDVDDVATAYAAVLDSWRWT